MSPEVVMHSCVAHLMSPMTAPRTDHAVCCVWGIGIQSQVVKHSLNRSYHQYWQLLEIAADVHIESSATVAARLAGLTADLNPHAAQASHHGRQRPSTSSLLSFDHRTSRPLPRDSAVPWHPPKRPHRVRARRSTSRSSRPVSRARRGLRPLIQAEVRTLRTQVVL